VRLTIQEFKAQMREHGLQVRKQKGLEVFDVRHKGTGIFEVTYAELYPLIDVWPLLERHMRPEYIPPLG